MPEKLSVIIPCKNEEHHIVECIKSVRLVADEIIVADSGSTDRTLELVSQMSDCRIIQREYRFSGDFKNWAIPHASSPWILIVDADERVTDRLADSIRKVLAIGSSRYHAYRTSFDCYFLGRHLKYSGWNTDAIRLFRRQYRYGGRLVHDDIDIDPKIVGKLKGSFAHYSISSYDQYFAKYLRYTSWGAEILRQKGRRATFSSLFFRPLFRFLHLYLIRGGILDGLPGLQVCMLTAFFNTFVKQARLWEHNQNDKRAAETNQADD
ncbi:MAG: glycosyltransferase family 2 protein, partial [Planctomycetia bacterium]